MQVSGTLVVTCLTQSMYLNCSDRDLTDLSCHTSISRGLGVGLISPCLPVHFVQPLQITSRCYCALPPTLAISLPSPSHNGQVRGHCKGGASVSPGATEGWLNSECTVINQMDDLDAVELWFGGVGSHFGAAMASKIGSFYFMFLGSYTI